MSTHYPNLQRLFLAFSLFLWPISINNLLSTIFVFRTMEEELNYEYTDSEKEEEEEENEHLFFPKNAELQPKVPFKLIREFPRIPPEPRKGPRKRIVWDVPWKPSGWLKRWRIRAFDYCFLVAHNGKKNQPTLAEPSLQMDSEPEPEIVVQPSIQPVSQPRFQPVSQPGFQPVSQPRFQPMSQPQFQPVSQPQFQPASQPPFQPVSQQSFRLVSQSQLQPDVPKTDNDVVDLTVMFKNDLCTNPIQDQTVTVNPKCSEPEWSEDTGWSGENQNTENAINTPSENWIIPHGRWKNQQERPRSDFKKWKTQQPFRGKQLTPYHRPWCNSSWQNQQSINTTLQNTRYFRGQGHNRYFQNNYVN